MAVTKDVGIKGNRRSGRDPLHVVCQVLDLPLELAVEPADFAYLALHVLAQGAQRRELLAAPRVGVRAAVLLLLVRWTREMLVQRIERAEMAVAHETFERLPIPRPRRCPCLHLRSLVLYHPPWICDDIRRAILMGVIVE